MGIYLAKDSAFTTLVHHPSFSNGETLIERLVSDAEKCIARRSLWEKNKLYQLVCRHVEDGLYCALNPIPKSFNLETRQAVLHQLYDSGELTNPADTLLLEHFSKTSSEVPVLRSAALTGRVKYLLSNKQVTQAKALMEREQFSINTLLPSSQTLLLQALRDKEVTLARCLLHEFDDLDVTLYNKVPLIWSTTRDLS